MPGAYTHWMVAEEALQRYRQLPTRHKYFSVILSRSHFVALGAVSPDYPFLTELANNLLKRHSWADRMHFENTGDFVSAGIGNLGTLGGDAFESCLAWLCGYTTHLIADTLIHPVVNATVGMCRFNGTAHRQCEMTQDSDIYRDVTRLEIKNADYLVRIRDCSAPDHSTRLVPVLTDFWTKTLRDNHPGASGNFDDLQPDQWHEHFLKILSTVSDPVPFFRHIGDALNLVYKKSTEIDPADLKRFVTEVRLPGGRTGHFRTDVFDPTVARVVDVWQKLFVDVENRNPPGCRAYLKNWDLDSGVDSNDLYFWS